MDGKTKIKLALAVFTMYTVVWLLMGFNGFTYLPWFQVWSEINFALVPSLILALVWAFVIRGFWKSRAIVKVVLVLIAGYSVFWLAVQHPVLRFLPFNYELGNWVAVNFLWVPLIDALTFTALGIYWLAKRPKKKPEPYLFG